MVSCVRFVLFLCTRDTANSWVLSARRLISILSVRRSRQSWRCLEEYNFFVLYFLICKISGLSVCSIRIPNFISFYFLLTLSLEWCIKVNYFCWWNIWNEFLVHFPLYTWRILLISSITTLYHYMDITYNTLEVCNISTTM